MAKITIGDLVMFGRHAVDRPRRVNVAQRRIVEGHGKPFYDNNGFSLQVL
jgi:hypothetical protein